MTNKVKKEYKKQDGAKRDGHDWQWSSLKLMRKLMLSYGYVSEKSSDQTPINA